MLFRSAGADELPDEEHAAPPSSAAGAHAKPLPPLFSSQGPSQAKGKGRAQDDDKEGFESVLARLQEGGECACTRKGFFAARVKEGRSEEPGKPTCWGG